jgi:beta-lactamase regulating signal transducer with metallopeptidase domain
MNSYPLTIVWLGILAIIALEVAVVALLFALVQRWCRTVAWRRTLCQAALVTSFVLALSEFSGSGRSVLARIFEATSKSQAIEGSGVQGELTQKIQLQPNFRSEVRNRLAKNQTDTSIPTEESKSGLVSSQESLVPGKVTSSVTDRQFQFTDSIAIRLLGIVLGIGAAFVAGRACLGRFVLVFLGRRRKTVADSDLLRCVHLLARSLDMSRRVRIIESPRLVSPIAFGFFRPTIGLPPNFCGRFSAAKQEAMLTHELAHLAAHDPFWYFAADLVTAVLWWHPAIWWLRRQLQLSSELAADEASLIRAGGPSVLAECLVEMGGQLAKPLAGQLRVAGFRSDLGYRVQRLMRLEGAHWAPISRGRAAFSRSLAPIAVAGILILCTAWAVPRDLTKGDSMKTMKQNWQRAFATIVTLAVMQTPAVVSGQDIPKATVTTAPSPGAGQVNAPPLVQDTSSPEFARRYGLPGAVPTANPFAPPGTPGTPPHGGRLEAKLREIVIDEIKFDGLPLSEVLNFLADESRKRDPEKKGINFLINPNPPQFAGAVSIDPTTGLPVAANAAESIDVSSVSVKFNMALRHVTIADVLDAIARVADHPIQYDVEDYAVIFSLRPEASIGVPNAGRSLAPAQLVVRTFHVDTNTFVGGLESAFGIKVDAKGKGEPQSKKIQAALKELLSQLNVSMDGNKAIFYNELTGTVMARIGVQDLSVLQAAIETLGGQLIGNGSMGFWDGAQSAQAGR